MCQRWLPIFDKIFKFDYFPVMLPKSYSKHACITPEKANWPLYCVLVKKQMPGIACCFNHDSPLGWHYILSNVMLSLVFGCLLLYIIGNSPLTHPKVPLA